MKKYWLIMLVAAVCLAACAGEPEIPESTAQSTQTETTVPDTTAATIPTEPAETTQPVVLTGWVEREGGKYYYLPDGIAATGWQDIDGNRYWFAQNGEMYIGWLREGEAVYFLGMDGILRTGWLESDGKRYYLDPAAGGAARTGWLELDGKRYCLDAAGVMQTGWLELEGKRYYLDAAGAMQTGWLELDGKRYCLDAAGVMQTGWLELEGKRYYLDAAGAMQTGWLELEGKRYYLDAAGIMQTGWLTLGGNRYYLKADGTMACGRTEINGKVWWFTDSGAAVVLVNPWNYMPADYKPTIVYVENGHRVSAECAGALNQMLADCRAAGLNPQIASSYRTHGDQVYLYERKVNYYLELGYSEADAKAVAGTIIALPGTSEHELGLALDLVDNSNWNLDESQENTPVQQWLMKNSWRYGFILRYPNGKSDVTGIIYEPWHYRYVGRELAKELYDSGLCLEEYLNGLG